MARFKLYSAWETSRNAIPPEKLTLLSHHVRTAKEDLDSSGHLKPKGSSKVLGSTDAGASAASGRNPGTPRANSRSSPLNTAGSVSARQHTARVAAATTGGRFPSLSARLSTVPATPRPRSAPLRQVKKQLEASSDRTPLGPKGEAVGGECCISPAVSRIPKPAVRYGKEHLPDWFRGEGVQASVNDPLLPEYPLWVTLHGGNGSWKQTEAQVVWEQQLRDHAEWQREWALREERMRAKRLEAERRRKLLEEEERRRYQEAEKLRRQREEDEARKRREEEEARLRRAEEEERQWRRRQPRSCKMCGGSGHCGECQGSGCIPTVYLAESVSDRSHVGPMRQRGSLPRGCAYCGGDGDGATWGEFVPGSGRCPGCSGIGMVPAPKDGWPDEA